MARLQRLEAGDEPRRAAGLGLVFMEGDESEAAAIERAILGGELPEGTTDEQVMCVRFVSA
jgi:hypothetical protein